MKNILPFLFLSVFCFSLQSQTLITFKVEDLPNVEGKSVGIRGNIPPLNWGNSLLLTKTKEGFQTELSFSDSIQTLEFKFVIEEKGKEVVWETNENRVLKIEDTKPILSESKWSIEEAVDINSLKLLSVQELQEDYLLMEKMVLEILPGTYRYNDKASIQKALAELKEKFQQPLSYGQAYLALAKLTGSIKCDHTQVGLNNQNKVINSIIHYQKDKLPFTFLWLEDKMIVDYNVSNSNQIKRGTRILKINDIEVEEIRKTMLPYIAADGSTDQNRIFKMQVDGYDFRYNAFDVLFPLLYPFKGDSISIEFQNHKEMSISSNHLKTLTREERFKKLIKKYPDFPKSRDDLWDLKIIDSNTALLSLNSFGLLGWKSMTIDYKEFLATSFEKMRTQKIEKLVIDIRKNMGGNDEIKDELFSYLIPKTKSNFEREGRSRYQSFPKDLRPHVKTWGDEPWFFELKPDREDVEKGYYIFENNFNRKKRKLKKNAFQGKVFMLCSAANTSLAFYTAYQFKQEQIGELIGEETGGNLNDINGGQILFFTLPNSQIEIDCPIMGGFSLKKATDSGVVPDVIIPFTLEDLINNNDPHLNYTKGKSFK